MFWREKSHLFTCAPKVNLRAKIMKNQNAVFWLKNRTYLRARRKSICAPKLRKAKCCVLTRKIQLRARQKYEKSNCCVLTSKIASICLRTGSQLIRSIFPMKPHQLKVWSYLNITDYLLELIRCTFLNSDIAIRNFGFIFISTIDTVWITIANPIFFNANSSAPLAIGITSKSENFENFCVRKKFGILYFKNFKKNLWQKNWSFLNLF